MAAYYNEIDPYAAQWLRNLITEGLIADGEVDTRSIVDVRPDDLAGFAQCHFFAGIGGWSYALRLAGWDDDRPVWTGSCPCQPFSLAGAQKGFADERHLWPAWRELIRGRHPPIVFGEQVASAIGWGWLDTVFSDLEGQEYACGAAVLPACGIGAPHIRQRAWFLADARGYRFNDKQGVGREQESSRQRRYQSLDGIDPWACEWLPCSDGKSRPIEPGTFPLAHGIPARVGRLRAYGNAIIPQIAAQFIGAAMSIFAEPVSCDYPGCTFPECPCDPSALTPAER